MESRIKIALQAIFVSPTNWSCLSTFAGLSVFWKLKMASPQIENGYTKIANEIMDALISHRLSGQEYQVTFFIIRKTYGFNKKCDYISMGQISKATGINRPLVARILKKLFQKNIIGVTQKDNSVTQKDNRYINCLYFSKDYEQWKVLHKKTTVTQKDNTLLHKRITKGVAQKDTHKRNNTKETITKEISNANFISSLKENPAYKEIDIDKELHKMDAWLSTPAGKGRKKTARFVVNWLNRIDTTIKKETNYNGTRKDSADAYNNIGRSVE